MLCCGSLYLKVNVYGAACMLMILLGQIAAFGLLAMLVMAANAIVFTWLGGRLGLLLGELYLIGFIFNMDLNTLRGAMDSHFFTTFMLHVVMVNLLLLPAWVLGMLLRKMNESKHEAV